MAETMIQEPIPQEIRQEWALCLEALRDVQQLRDTLGEDNPAIQGVSDAYNKLIAEYNRIKLVIDAGVRERPMTEDERRYTERLQAAEEIMARMAELLEQ